MYEALCRGHLQDPPSVGPYLAILTCLPLVQRIRWFSAYLQALLLGVIRFTRTLPKVDSRVECKIAVLLDLQQNGLKAFSV